MSKIPDRVPAHLMDAAYYKENDAPHKFEEVKPEYRVRDLKTGKWVKKHDGGKSWYQKNSALDALQKSQLRWPGESGRFVLEEYLIQIQASTPGNDELQRRIEDRKQKEYYEGFKAGGRASVSASCRTNFGANTDTVNKMIDSGILNESAKEMAEWLISIDRYFIFIKLDEYIERHYDAHIQLGSRINYIQTVNAWFELDFDEKDQD